MGDAEIIPLGTRGAPGRGTGRAPSSAARGLAGPGGKPRPPRRAAVQPVPDEDAASTEPRRSREPGEPTEPVSDLSPADLDVPAGEAAPAATGVDRSPATTRERHPLASMSPADWLAALQAGAREVFGDQWEAQLARFLAFWRRRLTGEYAVDEYGFDPEVTERLVLAALRPLAQRWFRIDVRGAENIPETGGALLVSNHSGTVPMDGLMTMVSVHDHTGRFLRPLGADLIFDIPVVSSLARKAGVTLACQEDAERMLGGGELVGVWPEGFKGIGKPYGNRYKLQRFGRGGFVSAALRTGVPIVPLAVVGAEEIYPLVGNIPSLARLLGVPYIPITPLFPWLGPLGLVPLPSKWLLEFGEPIRTDSYDSTAADDPMLVFDVTDQVRETIQQTLYSLLMQRTSVFT